MVDRDRFVDRQVGDLTVRVDRNVCIASENCIELAPEVFELDEESAVRVKADVPEIERARLTEACGICPVDALTLFDADGTQLVP